MTSKTLFYNKNSQWLFILFQKKKFIGDMLNEVHMIRLVSARLENIVEKGENAGYQYFSPFPTMYSLQLLLRSAARSKVQIIWQC